MSLYDRQAATTELSECGPWTGLAITFDLWLLFLLPLRRPLLAIDSCRSRALTLWLCSISVAAGVILSGCGIPDNSTTPFAEETLLQPTLTPTQPILQESKRVIYDLILVWLHDGQDNVQVRRAPCMHFVVQYDAGLSNEIVKAHPIRLLSELRWLLGEHIPEVLCLQVEPVDGLSHLDEINYRNLLLEVYSDTQKWYRARSTSPQEPRRDIHVSRWPTDNDDNINQIQFSAVFHCTVAAVANNLQPLKIKVLQEAMPRPHLFQRATCVIPEGPIKGAHFMQKPDFVQVIGISEDAFFAGVRDFMKLNIHNDDADGHAGPDF
ncbi:hypothetical protein EDD85DRAFT_786440 [Armillaria nabsnona]|nr:hypothetical protein EDD85DRAFT_786440 [Armillaria nabsnona]